jgi:hypothetical protein
MFFVSACGGRPGDGREGSTDKREWSILQGSEVKTRDTAIKNIEFHKLDDYNMICVPGKGVSKRIWVMMDAKSPPFYKQIPDCEATTSSSIQVSILPLGKHLPNDGGNVFIADRIPENPNAQVHVDWLSNRHMEVTYPAGSRVFKSEAQVKHVRVTYKEKPHRIPEENREQI